MTARDYKLLLLIITCLLLITPGCDRDTLLEPPARFWEPASAIPTGSILSLVSNGNGVIFAAAEGAGILRSRDGGETWEYVNDGLGNLYVRCLAVDDMDDIYAGVGGTIYRSRDDGESWNKLDIDLTSDHYVTCITINHDGDIFTFGTHDEAHRSTDGGATWQKMNMSSYLHSYTCAATDGDGYIFAGYRPDGLVILYSTTLLRSTDNGASWHVCSEGIPASIVYALDVDDAGTIFVATNFGVFYSNSHGDFWIPTSKEKLSGAPFSLAVGSSGSIFFGTSHGVFRSRDGGDSWNTMNDGLTDRCATSLLALPSGDICAGSFFGVIHTANESAMKWQQKNTVGLPPYLRVHAAASLPDGSIIAAIRHRARDVFIQSVVRSSDGGESWTHMTDGIDDYDHIFSIAADGNGRTFLGTYGAVFHLHPGATTWKTSDIAGADSPVEVLTVDDNGRVYAGTERDGIFRSDDEGGTWRPAGSGIEDGKITDIAVSPADEIYATTPHGIFRSTDDGESWGRIATPTEGGYIIGIDCNSSGDLFLISEYHLFRSTDNGVHWRKLPIRNGTIVLILAIDPQNQLWVGTARSGVFLSSDNGNSWAALDTGSPFGEVTGLIFSRERYVYAGTRWKGLYRSIAPID